MFDVIGLLSKWMLPAILALIPLYGAFRKVPVYESFIEGAKEGFPTAIALIPHLVGMMVAVSIFRESGALHFFLQGLAPILSWPGQGRWIAANIDQALRWVLNHGFQ